MSSVVNDCRQVLFFFFTNNSDQNFEYMILSNTFSISLLECTVSEKCRMSHCFIVLLHDLVHHSVNKETTVAQLSTTESSNLEGNVN